MADDLRAGDQTAVPDLVKILGGLGLLPFLAGVLFAIAGGPGWADPALRYYAATILAFMGGVHWGLAIADSRSGRNETDVRMQLIGSVLPSLIGWVALLMPATQGLTVMALAFVLLLLGDLAAVKRGWAPAWYPKLRMPLTTVVVICLLIAAWL